MHVAVLVASVGMLLTHCDRLMLILTAWLLLQHLMVTVIAGPTFLISGPPFGCTYGYCAIMQKDTCEIVTDCHAKFHADQCCAGKNSYRSMISKRQKVEMITYTIHVCMNQGGNESVWWSSWLKLANMHVAIVSELVREHFLTWLMRSQGISFLTSTGNPVL